MNDEAAFLTEIVTGPDSSVALCVYADWLEDRGDPRAEFLRLEMLAVQLAGAGGEDDAVNRRLTELRGTLDPWWLAAVTVPEEIAHLKRRLAARFPDQTALHGQTRHHAGYLVLHPPIPREQVAEAEKTLGFALPPLLVAVYTQIGNGGGVLCLLRDCDLVSGHFAYTAYRKATRKPHWPPQLAPISEVRGVIEYLDCSSAAGKVWRADIDVIDLEHEAVIDLEYESLAAYFADLWTLRGH